jgi:hypothetical protein
MYIRISRVDKLSRASGGAVCITGVNHSFRRRIIVMSQTIQEKVLVEHVRVKTEKPFGEVVL